MPTGFNVEVMRVVAQEMGAKADIPLDEALNILKVNGEYKKIYDKWFGIYEKRDLWKTIIMPVLSIESIEVEVGEQKS